MQSNQIQRYIGLGLGLLALGYILYSFSDIVTWIIIAWIVSLLGSPMMGLLGRIKIGKRRMGTTLRAVITMLVFLMGMSLFVAMFVPLIIQQGSNLASVNYASVIEGLEEPINNFYGRLANWGVVESIPTQKNSDSTNVIAIDTLSQDSITQFKSHSDSTIAFTKDSIRSIKLDIPNLTTIKTTTILIDSLILASGDTITRTNIQLQVKIDPSAFQEKKEVEKPIIDSTAIVTESDSPIERIQTQIFTYVSPSTIISNVFSTVIGLVGNLFILISSVAFIAFFFLREEELFGKLLKAPFSAETGLKIDKTLFLIKKVLIGYFEGILGQMTLVTLSLWLSLTLIGAENAFLIAFFGGLINIIPYIGIFMGMAFGLVVGVCSNLDMDFYMHTTPLLIKMVLVFFGMYAIDSFIYQPYIFTKRVKAHPLEVFIVIVVASRLGGVLGMVAAIPAYTVIRVIASVFLSEFKVIQSLTHQMGFRPTWTDVLDTEKPPEDDKQEGINDTMDDDWSD